MIKNKTKRLWNKLRTPNLKSELNLITKVVKNLIKNHNNQQYHALLTSLHTNNNSLWQFTNRILKKKITIPPINTSTGKAYTSVEKSEELASYFSSTFTNNISKPHPEHKTINKCNKETYYGPHHNIKFTNPAEINKIIKNLPSRKAPGHDNINNTIAKNLPPLQ